MRLLPLLLTLAACVPDIGDDDETDGTSEQLPDEAVCNNMFDDSVCSESRPCLLIDGYWQDCEGAVEGEEPECPCSGLPEGFGEVD